MSRIISGNSAGTSENSTPELKMPGGQTGLFQGAQLSGCTINIGFPLQQISSVVNTLDLLPPAQKKTCRDENSLV